LTTRPRDHDDGASTSATPKVSGEAAIAAVVRMLGDTSFAPELSADRTAINLHHCPFRELAESNPDLVCGAHLGMIQGALAELGAPVSATRLIPIVQPDLCIATRTRPATATPR
jgi:predicted ArsR family transcriptional regulator